VLVDMKDEHNKIEVIFVVEDDTFVVLSFVVVEAYKLLEVEEVVANYLNINRIKFVYRLDLFYITHTWFIITGTLIWVSLHWYLWMLWLRLRLRLL
jgi:hypothetical protein